METKMKGKSWQALFIVGIVLVLFALPLLVACAKEEVSPTPTPTPTPTSTPVPTPTPTPTPAPTPSTTADSVVDDLQGIVVLCNLPDNGLDPASRSRCQLLALFRDRSCC